MLKQTSTYTAGNVGCSKNSLTDLLTVVEELKVSPELELVGGLYYVIKAY